MEQASASGLYTQEQQDYVNGIKDEDLRSHLLHQVRAKENMEHDRNAFEKMLLKANLKDKIIIDLADMRADKSGGSYYYAWQANIAMAFKDEMGRQRDQRKDFTRWLFLDNGIHEIANQAAKNFLDTLIK